MESHESELVNYFDQSILDFKEGTSRFEAKLPKITKGYFEFTEACFEKGALTKKEKQLIALGISIYAQDEYCIMYHAKGCVENGVSEEEFMEAVGVSAAIGGGAAFAQGVTLAMDTFDYYSQN
ncbi:carboxymuconolactone decarboxylase family protein [Oceanobacillus kapialis]|uniref:carboxymuconolactone decarboxylase family protein n=1 Tax=Oceanobacillus kapialis TaxID=481353 RepID=UPI00384AD365